MSTTTTARSRFAPVIGAVVIAALIAACSAGVGALAPTAVPAPATPPPATPVPSPEVEDPGTDATPIRVDLDSASGQHVYVDIVDRSGTIERATSGRPGDGVSVSAGSVQVENLDPHTLRLSWSDLPDRQRARAVRRSGRCRLSLPARPARTHRTGRCHG